MSKQETGLWKAHFHWSVLLSWTVLQWTIPFLLGIGGLVLVFDQFSLANACFIITAAFVAAKTVHVAIISRDRWSTRMLFTFVLCGLLGTIIVETVKGVNSFRDKKLAAARPPVNPPANQPVTVAVEPKADESKLDEILKRLDSPPAAKPKNEGQQHPADTGNLSERASSLSKEIMEDLYINGWPRKDSQGFLIPPKNGPKPEEIVGWRHLRSLHFRVKFLSRVEDLRNDLAQSRFKDDRLEKILRTQKQLDEIARGLPPDIPTQTIVEIAERILVLANQVKSQ